MFGALPDAEWLLADRGYDADWFHNALADRGIRQCIPPRKSGKTKIKYDKRRYNRCPKVFLGAIALAATVIFWLRVLTLASPRRLLF